ncbi:MAG: hypothetical protein QOI73_844 [Solirubrobacteraceae bacterium]|nr:hypothetical protein [Solirubrobacteraceae bacterium]
MFRLRPLLIACVALLVITSSASADRAFSPRFAVNDNGAITIAANSLMSCPTGVANCATARSEPLGNTAQNSALDNGAFSMAFVDTDGDPSTANSSSADLGLPAGSTVLFAGLYWSAESNSPARNTIRLKAPGQAAYAAITGTVDDSSLGGFYQGFANVTARVQAAGAGSYTVGSIAATPGQNMYAGWALVVAYRDAAQPVRNLSVFDGQVSIDGTTGATINVAGFRTPATGPVRTDLGFVAWEGDRNITGDQAAFNGQLLSDAANPATNFFNSSIAYHGADVITRNPDHLNNLGVDADVLALPAGYLANGATTASIRLSTSGDVYLPGVVTFATELYAPQIEQAKTVANLTHPGEPAQEGDTLRYTISGSNTGQDGATSFVVTDPIPADTSFAAASVSAGTGSATYDAVNDRVVARLGTGATSTAGGRIAPGASYEVTIDVVVADVVADGEQIDNSATATYTAQTLGSPLSVTSDAPAVTVAAPDLSIAKSHAPSGSIDAGTDVTYTIDVHNHGSAATHGSVTVADPLPAGVSATSASGAGWTCDAAVTCTRSDPIAAADTSTITISAHVASSYGGDTVENTATVSGGGDADPADNSATDSGGATRHADLSLDVSADHATIDVGDEVTYTLTAHNGGPSDASGVTIHDTLPDGLAYVSDDGGCTQAGTSVICAVGVFPSGADAVVHVVARATSAAAGTTAVDHAEVSAAQDDPDPADNAGSASVDVTSADLSVTATLSPADPVAGHVQHVLIDAVDDGPSDASGVVLTSTVPSGLSGVSASADGGVSCTISGSTITCPVGPLGAGDHVHLDVQGTVDGNATTVSATAAIQGAEPDPDSTDNSATASAPVTGSADLSLTKTADRSSAPQGGDVSYTLTASNAGPSDAAAVTIVDHLPAGVAFKSADAGCANVAGTVTCSVGTVAAGAGAVRTITVTVGAGTLGNVTNSATVGSDTADPATGDNTSSASFTALAAGRMTIVSIRLKPPSTILVTMTCANVATCAGNATIRLAEDARSGKKFLAAGTVVASGPFSVSAGTATFELTIDPSVPDGLLESSKPLVTVALAATGGATGSATLQLRPGNT